MSHSNSEHVELMIMLGVFNRVFKSGDWNQALWLISLFVNSCRYYVPRYPIFYPWIVKAVCERHAGLIEAAKTSYLEAGKTRADDQNRAGDQNVFGGLAAIHSDRDELNEAEECYLKAMACASDTSQDERFNYAVFLLEHQRLPPVPLPGPDSPACGDRNSPGALTHFLLSLDPCAFGEDLGKVMNAQGIVQYRLGNFATSEEIFLGVEKLGKDDTTTVLYRVLLLKRRGRLGEAVRLLEGKSSPTQERPGIDPVVLAEWLANLYLEQGNTAAAVRLYKERLLPPHRYNRESLVRYALIQLRFGDRAETESACREMLEGHAFGKPVTRRDFYWDGFANYLLGRRDRARYDHDRSGSYDVFYERYDESNS